MRVGVIFFVCVLLMVVPAYSATMYVRDDLQVMVRTDPNAKRKIVATPTSGTPVEVLEESSDGWSKVRLPDKKEGWVLTYLLSSGPPNEGVIAKLKRENEALKQRMKSLIEENPNLRTERDGLQKAFSECSETLENVQSAYETLKSESSEFLALKASYEKISKEAADRTRRQGELEEKVRDLQNTRILRWFLVGAGVLFVGFIIGFLARRPKRRPSLL